MVVGFWMVEDWTCREVVLAAAQQDGEALQYASPELRADREVVLAAVAKCGAALQDASPTRPTATL